MAKSKKKLVGMTPSKKLELRARKSLISIITELQNIILENPECTELYTHTHIDIDVYGERLETDDEFETRIECNRKRKAAAAKRELEKLAAKEKAIEAAKKRKATAKKRKEAKDRKEYERLKKKFE